MSIICKCDMLWSATGRELSFMIKRELYMSRIRPFIGTDLIKVMTGIRRCGKSVMLELNYTATLGGAGWPLNGVSPPSFKKICGFRLSQPPHHAMNARERCGTGKARSTCSLMRVQEVKDWKKCINSFPRFVRLRHLHHRLKCRRCCPVSLRLILADDMWSS